MAISVNWTSHNLVVINTKKQNSYWEDINGCMSSRYGYFGVISNPSKWMEYEPNITGWLKENGCDVKGCALYFPTEESIVMFNLRWM